MIRDSRSGASLNRRLDWEFVRKRVGCSTTAHETGQSEIKRSISVQADCGGIALFERGLLTAALGNAGGVFGNRLGIGTQPGLDALLSLRANGWDSKVFCIFSTREGTRKKREKEGEDRERPVDFGNIGAV
jgi:hypothetical protein